MIIPEAERVSTIGRATLIHGDALKCADSIFEISRCVVTDPPYMLTSGGKNTGKMGGAFKAGTYDNSGKLFCDMPTWPEIMEALNTIAAPQAHIYCMANSKNLFPMLTNAVIEDFHLHQMLVWDKGTVTPNRWYMPDAEFVGFFKKGRAFPINDCGSKQIVRAKNVRGKVHPTQKPAELMEIFIANSTQHGDVVVDPFMGSGSTGVAALRLGRRFIGIESDAKHFDTACDMIRAHYREERKSPALPLEAAE